MQNIYVVCKNGYPITARTDVVSALMKIKEITVGQIQDIHEQIRKPVPHVNFVIWSAGDDNIVDKYAITELRIDLD